MISRTCGWIRFWPKGPGISWTRNAPLFSERTGSRRPFLILGRWRFFWLRRIVKDRRVIGSGVYTFQLPAGYERQQNPADIPMSAITETRWERHGATMHIEMRKPPDL